MGGVDCPRGGGGCPDADIVASLQKGQLSMAGLRAMNTFPVEVSYKGLKYAFDVSRTSAAQAPPPCWFLWCAHPQEYNRGEGG